MIDDDWDIKYIGILVDIKMRIPPVKNIVIKLYAGG